MEDSTIVKADRKLVAKAKALGANLKKITDLAMEDYIRRNSRPESKTKHRKHHCSNTPTKDNPLKEAKSDCEDASGSKRFSHLPTLPLSLSLSINTLRLSDFKKFCLIDKQLMESTVNQYTYIIANFLKGLDSKNLDKEAIRDFLAGYSNHSKYRYSNVLKALRIFVRDYLGKGELIKSFSFPHIGYEYREVPTREKIRMFYNALVNLRARTLFMLYCTSGLRRDEVRELRIKDLDRANRMIKPSNETSRTKGRFVSFWNSECDKVLSEYLRGFNDQDHEVRLFPIAAFEVNRIFIKATKKSGVKIKPTDLRRFFASEMSRLGVSETYINCYQGRLPRSVLSRHYLDLSKERLKEIYDKANLKVLE